MGDVNIIILEFGPATFEIKGNLYKALQMICRISPKAVFSTSLGDCAGRSTQTWVPRFSLKDNIINFPILGVGRRGVDGTLPTLFLKIRKFIGNYKTFHKFAPPELKIYPCHGSISIFLFFPKINKYCPITWFSIAWSIFFIALFCSETFNWFKAQIEMHP